MSTLTATATPPSSPANFTNDDVQIYISTATLQLKQNYDDYQWHTTVITPVSTETTRPQTEMDQPEVVEQCHKACKQQEQQHQPQPQPQQPSTTTAPYNNQRWTPAEMYGVPETIQTILDNFMASERYHTDC